MTEPMNPSGWNYGDRVRVLECPANTSLVGKTGVVVKTPAVGMGPPVLRVRIDGSNESEWQEVDGTAEKFQKLT